MQNNYQPKPINTKDVILPEEFLGVIEKIAKNTHEIWAEARMKEGWSYGKTRDDFKKETPCLVPYEMLSESDKEYDRKTTIEVLKLVLKLGFKVQQVKSSPFM